VRQRQPRRARGLDEVPEHHVALHRHEQHYRAVKPLRA
jgi:hypothetical protein